MRHLGLRKLACRVIECHPAGRSAMFGETLDCHDIFPLFPDKVEASIRDIGGADVIKRARIETVEHGFPLPF